MASINFRTVDAVLGAGGRPELAQRLAGTAPEDRRVALRHLVGEINRWMFGATLVAQYGLFLMVLLAVTRLDGRERVVLATAFALVLLQHVLLAPAIRDLGREIDFVARPLPAEVGRRFGLLHAAYVGADLVKVLLLALAASWLVRRDAPPPAAF